MDTPQITLRKLISDDQCYEAVRQLRWPEGVRCPHCGGTEIIKRGKDEAQPERQKYACKGCERRFDDLTGTIFAGHHQPLAVWVLCLYFMGLNLSNQQIAKELDLHPSDVQAVTQCLREGIEAKKPA